MSLTQATSAPAQTGKAPSSNSASTPQRRRSVDMDQQSDNKFGRPENEPFTRINALIPHSGQPATSAHSKVSITSTVEYSQIPFQQFQAQVEILFAQLFDLDPALGSTYFEIERMRGGGFNRITGVSLKLPDKGIIEGKVILRVPRFENARPDRAAAAQNFVHEYTSIPVPSIYQMDLEKSNPLESPYIIQSRIPGHDLQNEGQYRYSNLSQDQKRVVARDLGLILREMQTVRSPHTGIIEYDKSDVSCTGYSVRHFDLDTIFGLEEEPDLNRELPFFHSHSLTQGSEPDQTISERDRFERSTYYFLAMQFGRWRALELRGNPTNLRHRSKYERLMQMAEQMDDLGLLGDDGNYLCHLDLNIAPRNIMVNAQPDGGFAITGILDWDSAVFAPRFVGCTPPMWIWAWVDEGVEDEFYADDTPATAEQQELKRIFEDTVGPEFLEFSYRRAYRLARELFRFAKDGVSTSEAYEEVEELLAEWDAIYEIYTRPEEVEEPAEESQEGSL